MSLKLRGTALTSPRTKERVQKTIDIMNEVRAQMAEIDLKPYPQPKTTPEPLDPEVIEGMSNRELERALASYNGYAAYLQTKLVEAQIRERAATINLKAVKASLRASLFKDRVPKTEIDAHAVTSPEYIAQEQEHLKHYAIKEILEAHYNAFSKQASTVSRVIELRKLEFEQSQREHNVGRYKPGPLPDFKRRG